MTTVHFTMYPEGPAARPACAVGEHVSSEPVTDDPRQVTCDYCRRSEDFGSVAEYIACADAMPEATDTDSDRIAALRRHLAGHAQKIDGVIVDNVTAQAVLTVFDVLKPATQAKWRGLPYPILARIAWTLLRG